MSTDSSIELLDIIYEDFVNYKKPSMTLLFPKCSFKCEIEQGVKVCQNSCLQYQEIKTVNIDSIIKKYKENSIVEALVFQGLEPFDSFNQMYSLVSKFREQFNDDIVIYTGYYDYEIESQLNKLRKYDNIYVKFGRFLVNSDSKFDEMLGVTLASTNQYCEKLSKLKVRGFEKVSRLEEDIQLPTRSTKNSAGYDFYCVTDFYIPSSIGEDGSINPYLLLTGVKAYMLEDEVLNLYCRSSAPIKLGLVCANSVGIIDSDYYNNEDNEGEIGFLCYNLTNHAIELKKGDKLCQGVFTKFLKTDDDDCTEIRSGGFGSTGN